MLLTFAPPCSLSVVVFMVLGCDGCCACLNYVGVVMDGSFGGLLFVSVVEVMIVLVVVVVTDEWAMCS